MLRQSIKLLSNPFEFNLHLCEVLFETLVRIRISLSFQKDVTVLCVAVPVRSGGWLGAFLGGTDPSDLRLFRSCASLSGWLPTSLNVSRFLVFEKRLW